MSAAPQFANAGDPLWLSALLAGLGGRAGQAVTRLRTAGVANHGRMCIDGGATALVVARAPGPRRWEAHVLAGSSSVDGRQQWHGVRVGGAAEPRSSLQRTLFRGRSAAAVLTARAAAADGGAAALEQFEEWHRLLGPHGRIYSIGTEPEDERGTRIGWQLDRHAPVRDVVSKLTGTAGWNAAATSLALLHGFDVTTTLGPWSVSLSVATPARGVRIGTARWAWAVENADKRARLARWIRTHGGDGAYAAAIHDVLTGCRGAEQTHAVGRAVEVDVVDGAVSAASAYFAAPLQSSFELFNQCSEQEPSNNSKRDITWRG